VYIHCGYTAFALADRTRFVLDEASWTAFNDALDRPAEVKPQIREVFARSRPE
jgi:uncharacterized protein (DUF1778 family)